MGRGGNFGGGNFGRGRKEIGLNVIVILFCLIWTKIHKSLCCYAQGVMEEAVEGMEEMDMMDLVEMVNSLSTKSFKLGKLLKFCLI